MKCRICFEQPADGDDGVCRWESCEKEAAYDARVRVYEAEGMTRSDAQGVVDVEDLHAASA